jgi:hypothetical protein
MRQFTVKARSAVEAFAENLGVAAVTAADGSFGFSFVRSGEVSILPSDDGSRVILCLARRTRDRSRATPLKLFRAAGLDAATGAFVHAGTVADDRHILAIDIDEAQFNSQAIHEVISTLVRLHDAVA